MKTLLIPLSIFKFSFFLSYEISEKFISIGQYLSHRLDEVSSIFINIYTFVISKLLSTFPILKFIL